MERSFVFKKVRVYSKMLAALGLSSVLIGCAMNPSTETKTQNDAKNQQPVQTHERITTTLNMLRHWILIIRYILFKPHKTII
ncbi:hypothetical protein VN1192_13140 [Helicobacter pylori]|nr:hypothetical protein VN1192_13140 [Helicobacter pylori]